jgi:hypothetical protein
MKFLICRRIEAVTLLLMAAVLVAIESSPVTITYAYVLVAGVLLLMWRNLDLQKRVLSTGRLEELDQLCNQGQALYMTHKVINDMPTSWERSRDLTLARHNMTKWVDRVRNELAFYPEFAEIFEACQKDDPVSELRQRISRLTEIQRLIRLSPKVGFRSVALTADSRRQDSRAIRRMP